MKVSTHILMKILWSINWLSVFNKKKSNDYFCNKFSIYEYMLNFIYDLKFF